MYDEREEGMLEAIHFLQELNIGMYTGAKPRTRCSPG
jgi:hypothetical protein